MNRRGDIESARELSKHDRIILCDLVSESGRADEGRLLREIKGFFLPVMTRKAIAFR